MSTNNLLNSSILNSLFIGGRKRTVAGSTYTNTGDKAVLSSILALLHIVGVLNVAKLCDLTSSASPIVVGMFGGYVGGFFMLILIFLLVSKSRMRVSYLLWWKWFFVIFILILLIFAIVGMAMSNMGSSEDKGYGYTSIIFMYIAIILIIYYYIRMQIKLVPGSMQGDPQTGMFSDASNQDDPPVGEINADES